MAVRMLKLRNLSASTRVGFAVFSSLFYLAACGTNGSTRVPYSPKNTTGLGPAPIVLATSGSTVTAGDLAAAGNYTILAKSGISTTGATAITGNIGVSPAAASYITGFSLSGPVTDSSGSIYVIGGGRVYAADYAVPTPSNLTTAIGSMETAYTDAASRNPPDFNELATGNLGGRTLTPGLYTWTTSLTVPSDVTVSGGANDVWIFQTTGDVTVSSGKKVILSGGALAKNIFWQVAGQVTVGTSAQFAGIILAKTAINFQNSASLNGRALSQTMVSLDSNAVTP